MPYQLLTFPMLLPAWMLVVARVAGLVLAVPMFSDLMMPSFFRVILVVAVSSMMLPVVLPKLSMDLTLGQAAAGLAGEIMIGVLLGLAASVIFLGAELAGHVVSQQAGLSLGEVFNPALDVESSAIQQAWFFVALAVFIGAGGAQALVQILLSSFDRIPPLMFFSGDGRECGLILSDFIIGIMDLTFRLAIRLAAPALLALMLSTLAMGFLAKTMPQFNILTVGFYVKAALGIFFVALTMTRSGGLMSDVMWDAFSAMDGVLRDVARGLRHAG